jgi:predicted site-specific integrase-resolvase
MRPEDLAAEMGISAKTLRGWLRKRYPRPASQKHKPWHLSPAQVDAARRRFSVRRRRAESRKGMIVTTVAFSKQQHRGLVRAAKESMTVLTEIVRQAVDAWLKRHGSHR